MYPEFVLADRMFTALHRPNGEYDAPAPFAMPSYASVMGEFNHVSLCAWRYTVIMEVVHAWRSQNTTRSNSFACWVDARRLLLKQYNVSSGCFCGLGDYDANGVVG